LKDNHQIDEESRQGIGKKKKSTLKTVSEQKIEDFEEKLRKKNFKISELQGKLQDKEELVLDLINGKKILDKRIRDLELMELSLKLDDFEKLKMEYRKLEHRTQITKKQLDEARNKIESQKKYVAEAKERVEFMEKVINDLEKRGFTDLIRNRYPETFIEYQKK
jgi:chromosome segregation ATPase